MSELVDGKEYLALRKMFSFEYWSIQIVPFDDDDCIEIIPLELATRAPALQAENERLRTALKEVAKGEGPFSRDHKQHAINCIEHMVDVAEAALAGGA